MLKRIARRWNPEKAIEEAAMDYSKFAFLHNHPSYGDSIVTQMTEEWKKTVPIQMDPYATDVMAEDEDGDYDDSGNGDTVIHIPDWECGASGSSNESRPDPSTRRRSALQSVTGNQCPAS